MISKEEFLATLARHLSDEVVVTCMSTVRPWARFSNSLLDLASADSAMAHTADLALGIALAQPSRKVICLNGDGSMLMSLGTLATVMEAGVRNLILFVIDNGCFEITGGQRVAGAGITRFAAMARAAGFRRVYEFDAAEAWRENVREVLGGDGPVFVCASIEPGNEGPISRGPEQQARYLQMALRDSCREVRRELMRLSGTRNP